MNLKKMNTWTTPKIIAAASISVLLVVGAGAYAKRSAITQWIREAQQEPVPVAVEFEDISVEDDNDPVKPDTDDHEEANDVVNADLRSLPENNETIQESSEPDPAPWNTNVEVPESLNLAIPFTSQAPHANWELPYQEACEEASSLMAARFLQGRSITDANDADQAILQLVDYGTTTLGFSIDTTAEETSQIIEGFYELNTIVQEFDWTVVKQALAQGYPVIIPAAGQQLGNPYFTAPGPPYHMLVIKGYTPTTVITNDPGTRNGADYQYSYDVLENAIHDWNGGNVTSGDKVMIIVTP